MLALAAGLGCAKPNTEVLHILRSMELGSAPSPATGSSLALEVMPVRLPESLQRPQLVTETSPGALKLLEAHRWGNGLDRDLLRILVDNLSLLTGSDRVVAYPLGARVSAGHRLEIDVHRLEGRLGGTLTLQAGWMVVDPAGAALLRRQSLLQRPVSGPDAAALVAAHSLILEDFSREIAAALPSLSAPSPSRPGDPRPPR